MEKQTIGDKVEELVADGSRLTVREMAERIGVPAGSVRSASYELFRDGSLDRRPRLTIHTNGAPPFEYFRVDSEPEDVPVWART